MDTSDIDDILIRSLQGRTNAEEEAALKRWRAADPTNEARYGSIVVAWRMTARRELGGGAPPPVQDVLRAAAELDGRRSFGSLRRPAAVAALVAVSLAGGYAMAEWREGGTGGANVIGEAPLEQIVSTGSGERATVTLPDETTARLGPRTTLRWVRAGVDTDVWLRGRAFFGVHPDSSRAFTVRTDFGAATVLGTRFEVRAEDDHLEVAVVQGGVRVSSEGGDVQLARGQMSRFEGSSSPSVHALDARELLERMDWMGPVMVFRRTGLETAVAEIAGRYRVDAEVGDERIADLPVTGTLSDLTVDEAFQVICEIVEATCTREDDGFRIGGVDLESPARMNADLVLQ